MDEKQADTVNRLKTFIIEHYEPRMVILYGSTARGDTDEFSDIDIMVIKDVIDGKKAVAKILADTNNIVRDKHIMLRSVYEYSSQKDIPGTIVFSALHEGIVLYKRPEFDADAVPLNSYEDRKRDVIRKEYLEQTHDFMEKAERALECGQIYRCRDFLRFAAVRALKAVLVFRDVHPTRSIDLEFLFKSARELLPGIGKFKPVIEELNDYSPENKDDEFEKLRGMVGKTGFFVDGIVLLITGGHTGPPLRSEGRKST